jgi:GT2 family glycosyltransferase
MKTAVVTIVSGRHEHLRRQHDGLAASTPPADEHVVVAMGDPLADRDTLVPGATVVHLAAHGRLPLAAARNLGARRAIEAGAELVVFLDVDCIPAPGLLESYADAAATHPLTLLTGAVGYLPADTDYARPELFAGIAHVHGFRPRPPSGAVETGRHELFWSLSFAVTAETWRRLGGFHEEYAGYGAEDTDLGMTARERGIPVAWVGGAEAFHQHHETHDPPVQHLHDILSNGRVFARRWGTWPMRGWLDAFVERGLVRLDPTTGDYHAIRPPTGATA